MIKIIDRLVETLDLTPIQLPDGSDDVRLRIEIHRDVVNKKYFARVFRFEFYKMFPAYPGRKNPVRSDELILVCDRFVQSKIIKMKSHSRRALITKVLSIVNSLFVGSKKPLD